MDGGADPGRGRSRGRVTGDIFVSLDSEDDGVRRRTFVHSRT